MRGEWLILGTVGALIFGAQQGEAAPETDATFSLEPSQFNSSRLDPAVVEETHAALIESVPAPADQAGLTGFVYRLKPLFFEGKIAAAMTRATTWAQGLTLAVPADFGFGSGLSANFSSSDAAGALDSSSDRYSPLATPAAGHRFDFLALGRTLRNDATWALGHPQASSANTGVGGAASLGSGAIDVAHHVGSFLAEQAFAGHDVGVALILPTMPWLELSGAHYWWGSQDFTPEVRGNRMSLKLNPLPFVELEGGRLQDSVRSSSGFFSARLSIPLSATP